MALMGQPHVATLVLLMGQGMEMVLVTLMVRAMAMDIHNMEMA